MKQGLSLRVSQHLALTPQLQQSIRLLQLSTLELSQEVDQMLDENPFLELTEDNAEREEFGVSQADTPVSEGDRETDHDTEFASAVMPDMGSATVTSTHTDEDNAPLGGDEGIDWDGDGSTEMSPDDGEWGVDAKARSNNLNGDEDKDATELARTQESLQSFCIARSWACACRPKTAPRCAF